MQITIADSPQQLGKQAAADGAEYIRRAIAERGTANIILATGASQFATLEHLVAADGIDWSHVHCFHLDEYLGLPDTHPASFRRYLRERFVESLPVKPAAFHYIDGQANNPADECQRLGEIIAQHPIDTAFIGIGENAHLAFNDPPADFQTTTPYLVVELDDACRRQQMGESWFPTLEDVPRRAISMSVNQILGSQAIICSVPDNRKAQAVRSSVEGRITPDCPASILQQHGQTHLFLDRAAASQLEPGKTANN